MRVYADIWCFLWRKTQCRTVKFHCVWFSVWFKHMKSSYFYKCYNPTVKKNRMVLPHYSWIFICFHPRFLLAMKLVLEPTQLVDRYVKNSHTEKKFHTIFFSQSSLLYAVAVQCLSCMKLFWNELLLPCTSVCWQTDYCLNLFKCSFMLMLHTQY